MIDEVVVTLDDRLGDLDLAFVDRIQQAGTAFGVDGPYPGELFDQGKVQARRGQFAFGVVAGVQQASVKRGLPQQVLVISPVLRQLPLRAGDVVAADARGARAVDGAKVGGGCVGQDAQQAGAAPGGALQHRRLLPASAGVVPSPEITGLEDLRYLR